MSDKIKYDDAYNLERDCIISTWCTKKAKEFKRCVSYLIHNDKYLNEFALSLAWSQYNDKDSSKFFDDFELNNVDALCYLHDYNRSYEREVEEAFDNELLKKIDETEEV